MALSVVLILHGTHSTPTGDKITNAALAYSGAGLFLVALGLLVTALKMRPPRKWDTTPLTPEQIRARAVAIGKNVDPPGGRP